MGCTSSAPNMSDPQQATTTENEKKERNEDNDDSLKKNDANEKKDSEEDESTTVECNEIKMLPTCDTLEQNLHLDRKCNSPPDIATNEQERDTIDTNDTEVNVIMESEKEIPSVELEEEPLKCTTFGEVVDQVVVETIINDIANIPGVKDNVSQNDDETTEENVNQDSPIETKNACNGDDLEGISDDEDNLGETASPSQSECSRATRWEALADIAAELPPSLAVDPVTGQIYSLTK